MTAPITWSTLLGLFTCTGCRRTHLDPCGGAAKSSDGVHQLCWICNTARVEALWAGRNPQPPRPGRWHVTYRLPGTPRLDRYAPAMYGTVDYGDPRSSHGTRQASFAWAVLAARTAVAVSVTDPAGQLVLTWDHGQNVWCTWGLVADALTRYDQLAAARWAADQLSPQPA